MTRIHLGRDGRRSGVKHPITGRIRLAVAAAAALACLISVPAANATSLSAWPTFECHQGGYLRVDKIAVNEDGRATSWGPLVYMWNGRTWVLERAPSRANAFWDTTFGELVDSPFDFTVPRGRYYMVKDYMRSSGDARVQYAWADAMVGRVAGHPHECYMR